MHLMAWICLSVLGAGIAHGSAPTPAPVVQNLPIALVNLEKVTADVMQDIRTQVEAILARYQKEFSTYEERLRLENQRLTAQQQETDTDEEALQAFLHKKQAFEKKVVAIQRKAEERRKKLSEAHAQVLKDLNDALILIVKEVGAERNLALIIPQSSVIVLQSHLDISDVVQERLKKKIAKNPHLVKVKVND